MTPAAETGRHGRQAFSRWWLNRTLRLRLALWYGAGGSVLIAVFAGILYGYVRERMARPLDHQLRADLAEVEARLKVESGGRLIWDGKELGQSPNWTTNYPWFELWDQNGLLRQRCWPFGADRVAQLPSAPYRGRETISVFAVAPDLRLRTLTVPYNGPNHPNWMIRLMRMHEPVADALRALELIILVALPAVIALLVTIGYWFTRHCLMPLDRMAAEAVRISAENLSRRLPVANPRDELGRLASVFNVTLDRLENSFVALDRFVADASHELRTPLASLRGVGEVGLRRSRTVEEYREIIGSMLEEAQRLQQLIHRLLELATVEGGGVSAHLSLVQIDECAAAAVHELEILAEARGQSIILETDSCALMTDAVILRQAIQNLVDNAIKYGPVGSRIQVVVRGEPERVVIAVSDQGPGISAENRERLAERFFRPDRGRERRSGGFGLGLSITKAYLGVLGGKLEYLPAEPKGSTFRLILPNPAAPLAG